MVGGAYHVCIGQFALRGGLADKVDGLTVPQDFIPLDFSGELGAVNGDFDFLRVFLFHRGGERKSTRGSLSVAQALPAALVAQIPDSPGLFLVGFQLLLRGFTQSHTPAGEELGQVHARHSAGGEGNLVVIGGLARKIGASLPGLEELVEELGGICAVIGQVQLPVHAQLNEHVVGRAGVALGHLGKDGGVFVAGLQAGGFYVLAAVPGLDHQGVDIIGNFGLAQLVHIMADLMGDTPAEELVSVDHGFSGHHTGAGAGADADMIARRVHKGSGEHLHTADILPHVHIVVPIGLVDALGGQADVHDILPGQDRVVQAVSGGLLHGGGGQRQQDRGRSDFGHVQTVHRLRESGQLGEIVVDTGLALGLRQAVPVGQLQSGNVSSHTYMQLDLAAVSAAVGVVQTAPSGGVLTADLGDGQHVPAVLQGAHSRAPCGGLRVVLGGVDRDALSLRDAGGVDHDFVVCGAGVGLGLGGCAQRLEGASALAVVILAREGVQAVQDHTPALAVQKLLRQIQLVGQDVHIHVIFALVAVEPVPQTADLGLGHAGLQAGVGRVVKQLGNVVGQVAAGVVGQEHQLRQAHGQIVPLFHGDGDFRHVLHRGEGEQGEFAHVGHGGPGAGVAGLTAAGGNDGAGAVLVVLGGPHGHGVGAQMIGEAAVHPGHPDRGAQILGCFEGAVDLLAAGEIAVPVGLGGPVGLEIAVSHVGLPEGIFGGVIAVGHVALVGEPDTLDAVVLHHALGGDALRAVVVHGGGGAGVDAGGSAFPHGVSGHDVDGIGGAVGQVVEGHAGAGGPVAVLLEGGRGGVGLVGVVQLIVGGVFAGLPGHGQRTLQRGDIHHIGGRGSLGGLGGGGHRGGGLALPGAVGGGDGEQIGFQIAQAGDGGAGHVDRHGFTLAAAVPEPVFYQIAGDVGQGLPAQADLLAALGGGQALDLGVGGHGVFWNNIFQKFNGFDGGILVFSGLFHHDRDFFHRHPPSQGDGDDGASTGPALGLGVVEGDFKEGAVLGLHHQPALLDPGGVGGGGDDDLLHFHGGGEGNRDGDGVLVGGGEAHGLAVVREQVVQLACHRHTGVLQALAGGGLVHRGSQHRGVQKLCAAGRGGVAAEDGQVNDVDGPVAVEVVQA